MSAHDGPIFERNERGTVLRVRCSCGWSAMGRGGASAFGMAWGAHSNDVSYSCSGEPGVSHDCLGIPGTPLEVLGDDRFRCENCGVIWHVTRLPYGERWEREAENPG